MEYLKEIKTCSHVKIPHQHIQNGLQLRLDRSLVTRRYMLRLAMSLENLLVQLYLYIYVLSFL